MRISQKGLYFLQAMVLAGRYPQGAVRTRDIASEEALAGKFLELILLELKNARMLESVGGAKGAATNCAVLLQKFTLAEIIRLIGSRTMLTEGPCSRSFSTCGLGRRRF